VTCDFSWTDFHVSMSVGAFRSYDEQIVNDSVNEYETILQLVACCAIFFSAAAVAERLGNARCRTTYLPQPRKPHSDSSSDSSHSQSIPIISGDSKCQFKYIIKAVIELTLPIV
jgi:hypothetical protein